MEKVVPEQSQAGTVRPSVNVIYEEVSFVISAAELEI